VTHDERPITFSPTQRRQIVDATRRYRKVRRAISFARFSAGTTMFFGVVSLAFVGFGLVLGNLDMVPLVLGVGLVAVALNEYRGAVLLGRLSLGAPVRLAAGQIGLGLLIIGYCLWMISRAESGEMMATSDPQLREMIGDYESLYKGIAVLLYGAVIAATILFQGSAAVYYLTRRRPLQAYLTQTPDWIVEFERLRAGDHRGGSRG
jgi:hypothetical protein